MPHEHVYRIPGIIGSKEALSERVWQAKKVEQLSTHNDLREVDGASELRSLWILFSVRVLQIVIDVRDSHRDASSTPDLRPVELCIDEALLDVLPHCPAPPITVSEVAESVKRDRQHHQLRFEERRRTIDDLNRGLHSSFEDLIGIQLNPLPHASAARP